MHKILIIALVFVTGMPAVAEARCKFDTDDAGLLERGKRYTVSATMRTYVRFEFWRKGEEYFVNAVVGTVLMGMDANVDTESPLRLTLESGDVLLLTPFEESESRRTFFGFGINRKISGGIYHLPADMAEVLSTATVTGIEFQYKDDEESKSKSWTTRRGDQKRIRKGAACLFDGRADA